MTKQERTSERLRAGVLPEPDHVDQLIEQSADLAVVVDGDGVVTGISVNAECPSLGRLDHWVGRLFSDFLTEECKSKFSDRVALMKADPDFVPRPLELNHTDNAKWEFPVRYTLHRVSKGDELLLLGRDMQPVAEVQQRLVQEQMARERDRQKLRGAETCFRMVLEASETPIALVDPDTGRINELNRAAADLLGGRPDLLVGSAFAQAFEGRRRSEFMDAVTAAANADEKKGVEVVSRRNGRVITLCPGFFRASGELMLLCRMVAVKEDEADGPEVSQMLSALFSATSDAIVVTDNAGTIREANEGFLVMSDAAQLRDVRGRSMADFLSRGSVDLKLILDGAFKHGRMRNYSAQVRSVVGTRLQVDISAAHLRQRGVDLGVGLIIRDASPAEAVQREDMPAMVSDDAMQSVMELVGTASLKELVSATSDVIEKMCIETAVEMTGNNRVAAAEMLGLSRQSLYVKLRKHGLLKSGSDQE
ncbi:transcriptional regulator PpsR [Roseovarius salis]|uniref:transcriptional regulator PpsR n=1 Tax=Roseovarius salis TaxID=3376063 RepID=UPI0037C9522D